jgi:hypothetical protein
LDILCHSTNDSEIETLNSATPTCTYQCQPGLDIPESNLPILIYDGNDETDNVFFDALTEFATNVNAEDVTQEGVNSASTNDAPDSSLAEDLLFFFILYNVSHSAMKFLLTILLDRRIEVPNSVYFLKKMQHKANFCFSKIDDGEFAYLSMQENILFCLDHNLLNINDLPNAGKDYFIDANINIDGLPLFKSSPLSLWTILLKLSSVNRPLPIGCFCGIGKPNLAGFLTQFADELRVLKSVGMKFGEYCLRLNKVLFPCDTPARSYVQSIKGHTAKHGCGYCRCEATYDFHRVIFPSTVCEARTDFAYDNLLENNQICLSPLSGIVSFTLDFPPDYMHLVCLGVVRKLFSYYFTNIKGYRFRCKLSATMMSDLNKMIMTYSKFTPSEFQRRPRPLSALVHYKATEFRTFLLYVGPFFFKKFLSADYYRHFLLLHFSIYVLVSQDLSHLYDHAQRCIEIFVLDMEKLFGRQSYSYNVHVLLHLSMYVKLHGPLDRFSAFEFENYLSVLKRRVKKTRGIFKQAISQLDSIRAINISCPTTDQLRYDEDSPNNCAMIDNKFIIIDRVSDNGEISGSVLQFHRPLYSYPYSSAVLQIGYYIKTQEQISGYPTRKGFLFPVEQNEYIVIPLAV